MPNLYELIVYAIVNYIPYIFLAVYPFVESLRFSKKITTIIFFLFSTIVLYIFTRSFYMGEKCHLVATYLITLLSIVFYFISIKSGWGRMIFNLFMVKNIANSVVIISKFLESIIFPDTLGTLYHFTNSLCVFIVLLIEFPIVLYIVHRFFCKRIRDSINPKIWHHLWLIPLFFYLIWVYIFYFSPMSSLILALKPSSTIFMIFYTVGQIYIYICIAELVIYFNKVYLLKDENSLLSTQTLQYRSIKERIEELSKAKHDMRHHLLTLAHYINLKDYANLKTYLKNYIDEIPDDRISYCSNITLNMLIVFYSQKCKTENIDFTVKINIPDKTAFSDSDITVVFGNLLENAFEACISMTNNNRYISLDGKCFQNKLIFIIENTFENDFTQENNGAITSTKHEGYGIGTASVRNIVEKNDGNITFSAKKSTFTVSIILPFNSSDSL